MTLFILLFGLLTLLTGIIISVTPETVFGFLKTHYEKLSLQLFAVVIRMALGVFLIIQANTSKFPVTIEILGWISIMAGVFFAGIGRKNYKKIMLWALTVIKPVAQIGGIVAAAFGAFLIYAFA